jgi:uncharacterized protein (TIGR03435 family)
MQSWSALSSLVWLTCVAAAQTAPAPAFAVASVKPSARVAGKDARGQIVVAADRLSGRNVSLKDLIIEAYHLERYQVSGGPNWLDSDEFDIDARADGPTSKEQLRLMLRTLLADRFRLSFRREEKELRAYALVVDKNGPKIQPTKEGETSAVKPAPGRQPFHGDMRQLASLLSVQLSIPPADDPGRPSMATGAPVPVVDNTGLPGIYDFSVEFRPELGGDMFMLWQRILQDQLGLKLESRKSRREFLVVDRAERIPIAN